VKTKPGFTLIELIVVIAIIALLLAIFAPMVTQALEQTRIGLCSVNVERIVEGAVIYANDNHGAYPRTCRNGVGGGGKDHASWTSPFVFNFLKSTGMDMMDFACPNRGVDYIKKQNNRYRVGYYLLFGREESMAALQYPGQPKFPTQQTWDIPERVGDVPTAAMVGDIIEKGTWYTPAGNYITSVSHGADGLTYGQPGVLEEPEALGSRGGNVALGNGAVLWRPQSEMVERKVTTDGTVSGYW